jgi:hypothetical protein
VSAAASRAATVVGVLGVTLVHCAAAAPDALEAIDRCTQTLGAYDRIAGRCPELLKTLEASGWSAWLAPGWRDQYENMSASGLASLRVQVARELALSPSPRAADPKRLAPILAELAARNAQQSGTWWERLRAWLRGLIEPAPADADNWLKRFGSHQARSQILLRSIAYITFALVVACAALILWTEWRANRGARRRATQVLRSAPSHEPPDSAGWADVECASPADRPRVLLGLITARLTAARRLPAATALTVRQLSGAARLADAADRARLSEVARAAELLRYAPRAPSAEDLARALALGRELFDRLKPEPALASPGEEPS